MIAKNHRPLGVTPGPNDMQCEISEYYRRDFSADGSLPEQLSYGAVNPANYGNARGPYFAPAYLGGSDYSGTLVHVSNHRVFCDTFKAGQGVWWSSLYGGHGTFGVLIDPSRVPADIVTEVAEWLAGLDDYPLADEDDHSELEMEAQNAAWEAWARADFKRELEAQHECDLSDVGDDALFELFRTGEDRANVYWENQQGSEMYIDVDAVAGAVTADEVTALPGYKPAE